MRICSAGKLTVGLSFLKSCPHLLPIQGNKQVKSDGFGVPVQFQAWNNCDTPHLGNYPEFPEDIFIEGRPHCVCKSCLL